MNKKSSGSKGKFVSAMGRLAKLRSKSRSKNPLQVGNVLTKKAPMGGMAKFTSSLKGIKDPGLTVQASSGQSALNPKQQGARMK